MLKFEKKVRRQKVNLDTICRLEVRFTPRPHDLEKELSFHLDWRLHGLWNGSGRMEEKHPLFLYRNRRSQSAVQSVAQSLYPLRFTTQQKKSKNLQAYRSKLNTMPYNSQNKRVFSVTFYTERPIDFTTYMKSRPGPEFLLFSKTSRQALRLTQPFTQWWSGTLCQIKNWLGR